MQPIFQPAAGTVQLRQSKIFSKGHDIENDVVHDVVHIRF